MTGAIAPAPATGPTSWLVQVGRFTIVETATYLRDKTAIFWTFVYPIVLLALLMAVFGGGNIRSFSAKVDIEGRGTGPDQFVALLDSRFAVIGSANFSYRRVSPGETTPEGRVRIVVPAEFGTAERPGPPMVIKLKGEPDAESGSILSIVAESATQLNATLAGTPQIVSARYDIDAPAVTKADASANYYVVGLAVLSMVSTALFGFSGPLIDLRARGGLKLFHFMPVHKTAFLAGFAMCRVIVLVVFILLFILGGLGIYSGAKAIGAADWGAVAALVLLGTVAFLAAGLALAGLVTSNTLASAVINFVNLPIMFLSDLFIPLNIMPEFVRTIAHYSPIYLLVDGMRQAASGTYGIAEAAPALWSLLVLLAVAALVIVSSFRWRLSR